MCMCCFVLFGGFLCDFSATFLYNEVRLDEPPSFCVFLGSGKIFSRWSMDQNNREGRGFEDDDVESEI
jgi:hypothetical protein